jgi:dipeptidyl aminopeptidase/acylaminoacyl peptidase
MRSSPRHVSRRLRFESGPPVRFLAALLLGFLCAMNCSAQKAPNKSPEPKFWILFDADPCRPFELYDPNLGLNQGHFFSACWLRLACFTHDLYVMDQKGENVKRLTSDYESYGPSWSSDGRHIVFLKNGCGKRKEEDGTDYGYYDRLRNFLTAPRTLFWMDVDGRNSSPIAAFGPDAQDTLWVPDGKHIAVRMADRGNLAVELIQTNGSRSVLAHQSEEPLRRFLDVELGPAKVQLCGETTTTCWGSTGLLELNPPVNNFLPKIYGSNGLKETKSVTKVHGVQYRADLNSTLRIVSLDRAMAASPLRAFDSAWSSDGSHVAYSSFSGEEYSILYVADLHESEAGVPRSMTRQELDAHGPAWSPDGSRIAFAGLWEGSSQIFLVNVDGSNLIQLSHDAKMRCNHVSWSPDAKWIAAACIPNVTTGRDEYADGSQNAIYLFDTSKPGAKPRHLIGCRNDLCGARNPSFAPAGTVIQ